MGYASVQAVENILANALTRSTDFDGTPTILNKVSSSFDRNVIDTSIIYQYITWSDEEVDAALSELYTTPLCEKVDLELELLADIDSYNDTIELNKALQLVPGDVLIFIDGSQEERHVVDAVSSNTIIELEENLLGFYTTETARVIRVAFPRPIGLISARLAAANLYDKYFASQSDPGVTEYGKTLRAMAVKDLNNILNGRTILHGQRRIGNRFFNSTLSDRYGLPAIESDGSRNIEQV